MTFVPVIDPAAVQQNKLKSALALVCRLAVPGRAERRVIPYGWWQEADGAAILFDRDYRPVIRLCTDGAIVCVPSDTRIYWTKQVWIFSDMTAPTVSSITRKHIALLIAWLNLEAEITRRAKALKRGELPKCERSRL